MHLHFAHCAMRRRVVVLRTVIRHESLIPDRYLEEGLGRNDVARDAEPEVDRLSCTVNCTVKNIDTFATDLHIRLVGSPSTISGFRKSVPALEERRREAFDPADDRSARQRQLASGHYFNEVSKAERVTHIQDDNFAST